MTFQWDLMRSFLAVLREESLSGAARALSVSQPSIGRHVRQLESDVGFPLFERQGTRLVPTDFARQLAKRAEVMERGVSGVQRLVREHAVEASSTVRISASRMMSAHLLPKILGPLGVDVHAPEIELAAEDEVANLAQREADIGVRLVKPTQRALVLRRAGAIHYAFYASTEYVRARGAPSHASELAAHAVVGFDRSALMVRGARRIGVDSDARSFHFRSDDRVVQCAAVVAGLGIGVLPSYLAAQHDLVRVLASARLKKTTIYLTAAPEVLARPHVRSVFERLRRGLTETLDAAETP